MISIFEGLKVITLTGGPGGNKSGYLKQLAGETLYASQIQFVEEVAARVLRGGYPSFDDLAPAVCALLAANLQDLIYATQQTVNKAAVIVGRAKHKVAVCLDRGTADGAAYHPEGLEGFCNHHKVSADELMSEAGLVIHFETLAVKDPVLYEELRRRNPERRENAEQAVELDRKLHKVYECHPNRVIIPAEASLFVKTAKATEAVSAFMES